MGEVARFVWLQVVCVVTSCRCGCKLSCTRKTFVWEFCSYMQLFIAQRTARASFMAQ